MKKLLLVLVILLAGCSDSPTYLYIEDSSDPPHIIVTKTKVSTAGSDGYYDKSLGDIQVYFLSKSIFFL